jgi:hypothetical protein
MMAKQSIGSKNSQALVPERLARIFEHSFAGLGFSDSMQLGCGIEFSLQCRCLTHVKSSLSHIISSPARNPQSEPRNTRHVESIRDSRTRFFHFSTPISLTIPPAIMNPLYIDRAIPIGDRLWSAVTMTISWFWKSQSLNRLWSAMTMTITWFWKKSKAYLEVQLNVFSFVAQILRKTEKFVVSYICSDSNSKQNRNFMQSYIGAPSMIGSASKVSDSMTIYQLIDGARLPKKLRDSAGMRVRKQELNTPCFDSCRPWSYSWNPCR